MNSVRMRYFGLMVAIAVVAMVIAIPASAARVDLMVFENADNADVSGLDLWVDVVDGAGHVDMTFHNDSTIMATITQIYFESPLSALLANGSIEGWTGNVNFVVGADPDSPPGGLNIGWLDEMFSVGRAKQGGLDNGVDGDALDPNESLTVRFDAVGGATAADVVAMLMGAGRIAEHVQRLPDNDFSVSAVTVPLPVAGSAGLALMGAIAVIRGIRRRTLRG